MSKTAGCFPLSDFIVLDPDNFRTEFREWQGYLDADASTAGTLTHLESGYHRRSTRSHSTRGGCKLHRMGLQFCFFYTDNCVCKLNIDATGFMLTVQRYIDLSGGFLKARLLKKCVVQCSAVQSNAATR